VTSHAKTTINRFQLAFCIISGVTTNPTGSVDAKLWKNVLSALQKDALKSSFVILLSPFPYHSKSNYRYCLNNMQQFLVDFFKKE
jgi:hypothetical protein